MKAITYYKFGAPEVLQPEEIEKPKPKNNEVLIRIYASTVAAEDPTARKGPGLNGFIKPKRPVLGWYLAGKIEETGEDVTLFKKGDKVFGSAGMSMGTYAEYKCLPEDGALAIMPSNMNYEEAAAVPNGALTSLPFFRDKGLIKKGDKVLINGASGTVGSSAVQLAKYFGAEVTAVCSTGNTERMALLGADRVIDYTKEDFTETNDKYDIIFDVVGKSSFSKCKKIMKSKGRFLSTVPHIQFLYQIPFTSIFNGKKVKLAATGLRKAKKKAKDLNIIRDIIESGKYKAAIDRKYQLHEIAEAHSYVEQGHKKGDVVLIINKFN